MPRRTFAEARTVLDEMTLSPKQRREYEALLKRRVAAEVHQVSRRQTSTFRAMTDEAEAVRDAMNEVEDAFEKLESESRLRDMSAADYRARFESLQRRRERLLGQARSLATRLDTFTTIEDDPEGYLDSLFERYPTICPEFPW